MAFFRKKITKNEMNQVVTVAFIDFLDNAWGRIKREFVRKKGFELEYSEDDLRFCIDLWLAMACRLSALKQGREARAITQGIIENNFSNPTKQPFLAMADGILLLHPHDQNLFNNSTFEIFNRSFPHLEGSCCAYPHKSASMVEINGVELAACLRGIDFILSEYKVR